MLIANAEDFGLDSRINQGIAECFDAGIVRSVSLVANGPAFENALELIKKMPGVGIGVHLCLVDEKPLLPVGRVSSMIDKEGILPRDWQSLFYKIIRRRINFNEVENELDAQIRKVSDSGIRPTHLDSHQYTHLFPTIFDIVLRLGKKYNIPAIRCPGQGKDSRFISLDDFIKKIFLVFFYRGRSEALKENAFRCADHSCGFFASGRLSARAIKRFLEKLGSGTADIICHPGHYPQNEKYRAWGYCWEEEAAVLKNPAVRSLLEELNIKLTNYAA